MKSTEPIAYRNLKAQIPSTRGMEDFQPGDLVVQIQTGWVWLLLGSTGDFRLWTARDLMDTHGIEPSEHDMLPVWNAILFYIPPQRSPWGSYPKLPLRDRITLSDLYKRFQISS